MSNFSTSEFFVETESRKKKKIVYDSDSDSDSDFTATPLRKREYPSRVKRTEPVISKNPTRKSPGGTFSECGYHSGYHAINEIALYFQKIFKCSWFEIRDGKKMTSVIFLKFRSEGGQASDSKIPDFFMTFRLYQKNLVWWQFLCPHSIPPGSKPYFLCFFANPIFTWLLRLSCMNLWANKHAFLLIFGG